MKCRKMLGLALVISLAGVVFGSTPISVEQAKVAVGNFVRRSPRPLGSPASGMVVRAESEQVGGEDLFHVVYLSGGGYVVTSADKDISPIMVIGDDGEFEASHRNPVYSMLVNDLQNRFRALKEGSAANGPVRKMASVAGSSGKQAQSDEATAWDELLESAGTAVSSKTSQQDAPHKARQSTPESPIDAPPLTDIRVDKLLKTKWDQSTWGNYSNTMPVYNAFTPKSAVCGCVATAMAQVMYYWRYPGESPSRTENILIKYNGQLLQRKSFSEMSYDWSNMLTEFAVCPNISKIDAEKIGGLTLDAGLSVGMSYTSGESGAPMVLVPYALITDFGYSSAAYHSCEQWQGELLNEQCRNAIFSNLDARQPVLIGLSIVNDKREVTGGHCVVGDGYGSYRDTYYVHINCGWSGKGDAWYALPDCRKMGDYDFPLMDELVFNISPNQEGDIVSGRVLDAKGNAVGNAQVQMLESSGSLIGSAKSDGNGIYCFHISKKGQYFLAAKIERAESKRASVEIAKLTGNTSYFRDLRTGNFYYPIAAGEPDITYVGNKWGVDLYLQDAEEEKIEEKEAVATPVFSPSGGEFEGSQRVALSCATAGTVIRYTTDGSEPLASSMKYTGSLTVSESMTIKAKAYKDAGLPSDTAMAVFTKKVVPPVKLAKPTISPSASTFVSSCTVTLSSAESGATIFYTTDGSIPTTASTRYSAPFVISQLGEFTVNAVVWKAGNYEMSDVASKTYTVKAKTKVAAPTVSPSASEFALQTRVAISCDGNSTIHYTTDGTVPTASSPAYADSFVIWKDTVVRAIAIPKDGTAYLASDPVAKAYKLKVGTSLSAVLNAPTVSFEVDDSVDGTSAGLVTGRDAKDGAYALQLKTPDGMNEPAISLTATVTGPGLFSFWTKGDGYSYYDSLFKKMRRTEPVSCLVDGRDVGYVTDADKWVKTFLNLSAGAHTIVWTCTRKGNAGTCILDCMTLINGADAERDVAITFDANGGEGVPSVRTVIGKTGSSVTLAGAGTLNNGLRRLMGWNTAADGSGKLLALGTSYRIDSIENFTLYAMWQEIVPVYMEVPYDATSCVFEVPAEYGYAFYTRGQAPADWVENHWTLYGSIGSDYYLILQLGLGAPINGNFANYERFRVKLDFKSSNDSSKPRTFQFPLYPKEYTRAPVFTVIQLPDRETDKLAGISLSAPSVANAVEGTKITCKTQLRNGKQQVVASGVTWSMAEGDKTFAVVNEKGEVKAKASLSESRTVTVRAAYADAGGYSASAEKRITLVPDVDLTSALDATDFNWATGAGVSGWYGQSAVSSDGSSSAMAGSAFLGTPRLSTTLRGPGTVRCKCRVTGMMGGGTLWMIVDEGTAAEAKHFCATYLSDAPSDWVDVAVPVTGLGAHMLAFVYTAEGTVTETPDDNAYVDGFAYEPDRTVPYVVEYRSKGVKIGSELHCIGEVFALDGQLPLGKNSAFAGWACSNGRRYDDGMLVFNLAKPGETVTMTAIWE